MLCFLQTMSMKCVKMIEALLAWTMDNFWQRNMFHPLNGAKYSTKIWSAACLLLSIPQGLHALLVPKCFRNVVLRGGRVDCRFHINVFRLY